MPQMNEAGALHTSIKKAIETGRLPHETPDHRFPRRRARDVGFRRSGLGSDRNQLLLPHRGRWTDHQDRRRLRQEVRGGEPRYRRQAGLYGQLSGLDRQGDDSRARRQRAGCRRAVVHGHVHTDRRGDDPALRPDRYIGRRQGLALVLLSRIHGEQPGERPHLGRAIPAFDHRPVLQQGGFQEGWP